ncbi:MAG: GAF domain-containing protein, partial [Pseudomonadota bacterium]
ILCRASGLSSVSAEASTVSAGALLFQLSAAAAPAAKESFEDVLRPLSRAAYDCLGDPHAAFKQGALKEGERDYRVAGIFVITPDRRYNMLVASQGFPPEQRRLAIPIAWNHPGHVVETEAPLILENTDDHAEFRQFLRTSRMGSSLYHPIRADGVMVAQIVAAAQARNTYTRADLDRLAAIAGIAGLIWSLRDGNAFVKDDYPAPDIWRAEEKAL